MEFSNNIDEFVTGMGSFKDNIIVWNYPTLEKISTIDGHMGRVLYMTKSPNDQKILTGAGD